MPLFLNSTICCRWPTKGIQRCLGWHLLLRLDPCQGYYHASVRPFHARVRNASAALTAADEVRILEGGQLIVRSMAACAGYRFHTA